MKKRYEKPELFMESFEVAEFIAGNCQYVANHDISAAGACRYYNKLDSTIIIFTKSVGCNSAPMTGEWDKFCYNEPQDTSRVFTS